MGLWSRSKKSVDKIEEDVHESNLKSQDSPERYCRSDMYRFPAGDDRYFVYSSFNRSAHLLPSHTLHVLDACSTFKSISDHTEDYCYANPLVADGDQIERQLADLVSAGLLISYTELLEHCERSTSASAKPLSRIQSIGVVTRNRVGTLQDCLTTYMENVDRSGRTVDFVVMDDSPERAVQLQTGEMLSGLKAKFGMQIYYGTLQDRSQFAEALIADGDLPPDVVNFALFDTVHSGFSVGANRNALMLDTVGEMVLSVDDDTQCYLTAAPNVREEVTFAPADEFMKFWFYEDRESALKANVPIEKDILGAHEQLLGRDLISCMLANTNDRDQLFTRIDHRQIRDLQAGRGTVLATFMGIVGDSAMPAPVSYLLLKGASRERLTNTKRAYLSALKSREVLRVSDRLAISGNAWCVTTAYGYDNRHFLPPFMPVGRGEDDIFGFTLHSSCEPVYLGYLPYAVLHAPPEKRLYRPNDILDFASTPSMCTFMLACITSFNQWPGLSSEKDKLEKIGKYLLELGSLAQPDFEEFLRVQLLRMNSDYISVWETLLNLYEREPEYWTNDVEDYVETLRTSLTKEAYTTPHDFLNGSYDDGDLSKLFQQLVFKFGQLFCWWSAIRETSQRLKAKGTRLAVAVK